MSTHGYVGTIDPANPHLARARYVHLDGHPAAVVPALARIWASSVHRDSPALVDALLAHDWGYLDASITAATVPAFARQRLVPSIGMTLAAKTGGADVEVAEPVTVFPLSHATHLDAHWTYLIDPVDDSVTVYTDDGEPVGRYHLTASPPTAPSRSVVPAVPR